MSSQLVGNLLPTIYHVKIKHFTPKAFHEAGSTHLHC